MAIYRQSSWTVYFYDRRISSDSHCIVKIDGPNIVVEYEGANRHEPLQYTGFEEGEGHYHLTNPTVGGTATLHRFRDSSTLEGSWNEGSDYGMWTIELSDEE